MKQLIKVYPGSPPLWAIAKDGEYPEMDMKEYWKEINEIQIGKWYKNPESKSLYYIKDIQIYAERGPNSYLSYGFDSKGNWSNDLWRDLSYFVEATDKEVKERLEKYTKEIYPIGTEFKTVKKYYGQDKSKVSKHVTAATDNEGKLYVYSNDAVLYHEGVWAEIIEEKKDLSDALVEYLKEVQKFMKAYDEIGTFLQTFYNKRSNKSFATQREGQWIYNYLWISGKKELATFLDKKCNIHHMAWVSDKSLQLIIDNWNASDLDIDGSVIPGFPFEVKVGDEIWCINLRTLEIYPFKIKFGSKPVDYCKYFKTKSELLNKLKTK